MRRLLNGTDFPRECINKGYEVIDWTLPGATTNDITRLVEEEISKREEMGMRIALTRNSMCIIWVGSNDVRKARIEEECLIQFDESYRRLIDVVSNHFRYVIIVEIPPSPKFSEKVELVGKLNEMLRIYEIGIENVYVVRVQRMFTAQNGAIYEKYFETFMGRGRRRRSDGIHVNKMGLTIIKKKLLKVIRILS